MSVIGYVKIGNKIKVAGEGIVMSDTYIVNEDAKKVGSVEGKILFGVTGVSDTTEMLEEYIRENIDIFCNITNNLDALRIMKDFPKYCMDNYGETDKSVADFGGFMIVGNKWRGIIYYNHKTDNSPYIIGENKDHYITGYMKEYIDALLDVGYDIEDAIKMAAKKCTQINDHVTSFEIEIV